ncbi:hypothetical protein [Pararcticibacter amylolyticus]|uniref:hypothetical protein n=1 Tax=Pararcticibacter amylolyticus TaxID=2173175 RepID=UPI0011B27E78|nr:hypothetical protein [Pararcticibacter amylolyticus]
MNEKRAYSIWAAGGFLLVSFFGVILRLMFVWPVPGVNYSFFLHAHSHFAFSGWIFLALSVLISCQIHGSMLSAGFKKMFMLTLISAFGMLISFSVQGYKLISISFSTLFIFTNFYFTWLVLRDKQFHAGFTRDSLKLLKASLFFLCFSCLGPFALAPLMKMGLKGSVLYQDAIYFYLHMQMNGWMLLAALALIVNRYKIEAGNRSARRWLQIFIWSTLPLYLIFTLWGSQSVVIRGIALAATLLNVFGWFRILISIRNKKPQLPAFIKIALIAVSIKCVFQVVICFPAIGNWAFSQRNLIIGYIHLLMLGAITSVILDSFTFSGLFSGPDIPRLNRSFASVVILYVTLLFLQPALSLISITIPSYQVVLLVISVLFLLLSCLYFRNALRSKTIPGMNKTFNAI